MLFARNLVTVGAATLLSRMLGFARDIGIAAVLGAGVYSDAFFAALQIPNLFRRLLAEGALNAAFVPLWLRVRKESGEESARIFNEQVLGTLVAALAAIAIVCIVFAPAVVRLLTPGFVGDVERFSQAVFYVRISAGYVVMAGAVAVATARLNAEGHVAAGAFGLVVFNIVMIVAVAIIVVLGLDASAGVGAMLSAAIVVAGLWQLLVVGLAVLRLREAPRALRLHLSSGVRRFYALMLPGAVAVGIPQMKFIVGTMVASSSQHAVSWLYYANRLYELPAGVVSVAVAAVMVPVIAASVRSGDSEAITAAQSRTIEIAVGLALPAAVALALLAHPIVGTLFQRGAFDAGDTAAVAAALAMIVSGLPGQTLEKVFGAMCFAREDTRAPMLAGLAGLVVAALGSVVLFPLYGYVGVAAAIALSGWVGAGCLGIVLVWRGWIAVDSTARQRLPRILLAAAIMGGVVAGVEALMVGPLGMTDSQLGRVAALAGLVVLGVGVYLALLAALNVARPREIAAAVRVRL
jgi:putative peptidoglycan lipid II flippase